MTLRSYCCFLHPTFDYSPKSLDDVCPTCGRPYRFPLDEHPQQIGDYRIVKSLGRGFYGATYVAQFLPLDQECVLKVSPVSFYEFFKKDFVAECKQHLEVSKGRNPHVVPFERMLPDVEVGFGDEKILCNISQLGYVPGKLLGQILREDSFVPAHRIAQIAIDLFRILDMLRARQIYHNDLHPENIIVEELGEFNRRAEEIDPSVRVVAIDLGSAEEQSRSTPTRLNDIHWVAVHINSLVQKLLRRRNEAREMDYRLASALEEIHHSLAPQQENQRLRPVDLVVKVQDACRRVAAPWMIPLDIHSLGDAYNAQTLAPWYAPMLLVDPGDQWLSKISIHGPQIITGMRGCGKTLMLRALELHARAAGRKQPNGADESAGGIVNRLKSDHFVGLYVSVTRLLDASDDARTASGARDPYVRLYVGYSLAAVRAVLHLQDVAKEHVLPSPHRILGKAVSDYLEAPINVADAISLYDLECRLIDLQVALNRSTFECRVTAHPSQVFPHLAAAVKGCSGLWDNSQVFFLLDDVSTRYLPTERLAPLFSDLMFQDTACAFKFTSESQTVILFLQAPGNTGRARAGRDYKFFDLGSAVYETIQDSKRTGEGTRFVESILTQRGNLMRNPPIAGPAEVLGDVDPGEVSNKIVQTHTWPAGKRFVYHGITALRRVCVGDIGDIITLYELILEQSVSDRAAYPVGTSVQSTCFQKFCGRRLYDLSRREKELADFATSFAQAAYTLLVRSADDIRQGKTRRKRLRHYSHVFVTINESTSPEVINKIRQLVDAGIFVFTGGATRFKSAGTAPEQQYKLTFRKIYGLAEFISLGESDRFELAGKNLEQWLFTTNGRKAVLLEKLGHRQTEQSEYTEPENTAEPDDYDEVQPVAEPKTSTNPPPVQFSMETAWEVWPSSPRTNNRISDLGRVQPDGSGLVRKKTPVIRMINARNLAAASISTLVTGLGFEDRALKSTERLLEAVQPPQSVLIRYPEPGHGPAITKLVEEAGSLLAEKNYLEVRDGIGPVLGTMLIDITGLSRAAFFHIIRHELASKGRLYVCHTKAELHHPTNEEIAPILEADRTGDYRTVLEHVLPMGEFGPYQVAPPLLDSDADLSGGRLLCAFASPKPERLLKLLYYREYDQLEIVAPMSNTNRSKYAGIVAEVATINFPQSRVTRIDTDDLAGILSFLVDRYQYWYVDNILNFQLNLSGSKTQALACAIMAAAFKISQCWYVYPEQLDKEKYSEGYGDTVFYEISLPEFEMVEG